MNKKSKLKVMRKLVQSGNYIVVTDSDAFMSIDLGETDINDVIVIAEQRAALVNFQNRLKQAIRQFDKRLAAKKPKNTKKIPVVQG
jgi:RNA processing factor Prp31